MENNRVLRKSRKVPPSRASSSFNERSNSLIHPSSTEELFDSPYGKGMLISSSSYRRTSISFFEKKRKEKKRKEKKRKKRKLLPLR